MILQKTFYLSEYHLFFSQPRVILFFFLRRKKIQKTL